MDDDIAGAAAAAAASSLSSSSTSNAFNTWTILPADRIELVEEDNNNTGNEPTETTISAMAATTTTAAAVANRAGDQNNKESKKQANDRCSKAMEDSQADDISDGISIISDCESTERISPHPFLRDHLHDLSYKFDSGDELPEALRRKEPPPDYELELEQAQDQEQLRQRQRRRGECEASLMRAEELEREREREEQSQILARGGVNYLPPLVQSGLTGLFYVGATLAVLAFIGKLRYPEWQVLSNGSNELEQKLNELELQNNLMRAEIDIISKQLQYLSNVAAGGQAGGQRQERQEQQQRSGRGKTFKAWSGNGNSVDPVDITKADLKRPYECPDGKFVEIAAMCLENNPHAESLADEIGNVVNNVLQNSQTFQSFEKITEKLGTLTGEKSKSEAEADDKQIYRNGFEGKPPPPHYHKEDGSKERYRKREHSNERVNQKREHSHEKREHSNERGNQKRDRSNERGNQKREQGRSRSKELNSKEQFNKYDKKYADNSKERFNKYADKSKRHDPNHNGDQDHSDESGDGDGSGEWHEKMMQQREYARRQQEQKRHDKNWYIERGGSREQMRGR